MLPSAEARTSVLQYHFVRVQVHDECKFDGTLLKIVCFRDWWIMPQPSERFHTYNFRMWVNKASSPLVDHITLLLLSLHMMKHLTTLQSRMLHDYGTELFTLH